MDSGSLKKAVRTEVSSILLKGFFNVKAKKKGGEKGVFSGF
jgi:hypothetical protein